MTNGLILDAPTWCQVDELGAPGLTQTLGSLGKFEDSYFRANLRLRQAIQSGVIASDAKQVPFDAKTTEKTAKSMHPPCLGR